MPLLLFSELPQITIALSLIETALPGIETALPEIETALLQIEIVSEDESRFAAGGLDLWQFGK